MSKTLQQAIDYCVERQRDFPDLLAFIYGERPEQVEEKFNVATEAIREEWERLHSFQRTGNLICPTCLKLFSDHPSDLDHLFEGRPFLRLVCDGRRVKL